MFLTKTRTHRLWLHYEQLVYALRAGLTVSERSWSGLVWKRGVRVPSVVAVVAVVAVTTVVVVVVVVVVSFVIFGPLLGSRGHLSIITWPKRLTERALFRMLHNVYSRDR